MTKVKQERRKQLQYKFNLNSSPEEIENALVEICIEHLHKIVQEKLNT